MAKRTSGSRFRIEHDLLGQKRVPAKAYYGIQAMRGMENFSISGVPLSHYPDFIRALAMVKMAAARANHAGGGRPRGVRRGMGAAWEGLIAGRFHAQSPRAA